MIAARRQRLAYRGFKVKTNSLQPNPRVSSSRCNVKPWFASLRSTSAGLATSNGYPPNQSRQSWNSDIPRFCAYSRAWVPGARKRRRSCQNAYAANTG